MKSLIGKKIYAIVERVEEYGLFLYQEDKKIFVDILYIEEKSIRLKDVYYLGRRVEVYIYHFLPEKKLYLGSFKDIESEDGATNP